jgi:SAM-dependent methyltransferase
MTQNIYDNPEFFAAYGRLRRSTDGLEGAPEWPALRAMLPPMQRLDAVDLGCGFGWFCRWAREQGASSVLGVDVSENMLARARETTSDAAITYEHADLEALALPAAQFDLVFSSLALHYVDDIGRLIATVHQALVPGGHFVFSIEHPIYTAPRTPGWSTRPDGQKIWPVESYADEGLRTTDWLTKGVRKYHRTLGTLLNALIDSNFALRHVEDFRPTGEQIALRPELAVERERPMFLLIAAEKH